MNSSCCLARGQTEGWLAGFEGSSCCLLAPCEAHPINMTILLLLLIGVVGVAFFRVHFAAFFFLRCMVQVVYCMFFEKKCDCDVHSLLSRGCWVDTMTRSFPQQFCSASAWRWLWRHVLQPRTLHGMSSLSRMPVDDVLVACDGLFELSLLGAPRYLDVF